MPRCTRPVARTPTYGPHPDPPPSTSRTGAKYLIETGEGVNLKGVREQRTLPFPFENPNPTKNVGLPQRTRFVSIYYPLRYNLLTLLTAKGSGFTKIIKKLATRQFVVRKTSNIFASAPPGRKHPGSGTKPATPALPLRYATGTVSL